MKTKFLPAEEPELIVKSCQRLMNEDDPEKRVAELESKLKEAADFIHSLGPTIDYPILDEINELLQRTTKIRAANKSI